MLLNFNQIIRFFSTSIIRLELKYLLKKPTASLEGPMYATLPSDSKHNLKKEIKISLKLIIVQNLLTYRIFQIFGLKVGE
jgi:hypothetical protein